MGPIQECNQDFAKGGFKNGKKIGEVIFCFDDVVLVVPFPYHAISGH